MRRTKSSEDGRRGAGGAGPPGFLASAQREGGPIPPGAARSGPEGGCGGRKVKREGAGANGALFPDVPTPRRVRTRD